jgi:NADH-quinone oxidoreductase subunit F
LGGPAYAKLGTPNNTGTRIVSVSGHVRKPGYYEVEVGKATLGEMIMHPNFGGGLRDGRSLKAVIPGGSSAKVFKAGEKFKLKRKGADGQMTAVDVDMLDLPYDFDSLQQAGSMSGSGAIIVLDDTTDIIAALANLSDFYAHESCGQCTPCREGSLWLAKALHRMGNGHGRKQDTAYLLHIAQNIQGRTICAFGEACAWPVLSFINKFRDEFEARGAADEAKNQSAAATHGMKIAAHPQP